MKLNEVVVTGLTGSQKLKQSPAPISFVSARQLEMQPSTNIIDAIAHQPGVSQITTGSGISKPVIRGLGFNRVVVVNDGVRQEGQQWGDEHGIEIDPASVHSVEILKGPASLMYGSDAMAGVLIFHSAPTLAKGDMRANFSTGYQTNNGLLIIRSTLPATRTALSGIPDIVERWHMPTRTNTMVTSSVHHSENRPFRSSSAGIIARGIRISHSIIIISLRAS